MLIALVKHMKSLLSLHTKSWNSIVIYMLFSIFLSATHLFAHQVDSHPEDTKEIPESIRTGGDSALSRRLDLEKKSRSNFFSITPHRPNYILPVTYSSSPNSRPYQDAFGIDEELDDVEVKFQLSLKFMLWEDMIGENGDLWVAYTQQSYWQLYNQDFSSPFRETNYEPEVALSFKNDYKILGFTNRLINLGFTHQSNGRSEPLSRSWNRIYASFAFDRDNLTLIFKPWYRIPEDDDDDDNPNIEDYIGRGEISAFYKMEKQVVGLILRNNFKTSDNRGSIQLDWSYPLTNRLKGYVQYFNGYGESLIDYNHSNKRIGVGVMLTDWL
jgi:phospholipase A1